VSIGVASGPGTRVRATVVAADDALLAAKRAGKDGLAVAGAVVGIAGPPAVDRVARSVAEPADALA